MLEAYKIGILLNLQTNSAQVLGVMSQALKRTDTDVVALNKRLGLIGTTLAAGGALGLHFVTKMIKPAEEYTSQLVKMNMAGMKQAEIASAVGDAWKLAGQNMTTTATGNLKALLDLRNVTGSMEEARHFLPVMQRMQTVLAASKDGKVSGHSGDLAFSAMKALDIRGAINDPKRLDAQADLMTRVIIGTQGRVTPEQFQSVFNYARQAKFSMSDDFAYKILPTLMLENASKGGGGGGSRGVGPQIAALYRFTNQGFVNKKALPLLSELGMLSGGTLNTTTRGTMTGPLKDSALAAANSFLWAGKLFDEKVLPYLKRHQMEATDNNVLSIINQMTRGNQLAGSLLGEYYVKRKNFQREQKLLEGVMSPDEAYKMAMTKDPATARRALSASWENFETSLMMNVVPVLVPALNKLAKGLNVLGDWAREHPDMTQGLVVGFAALSGAMAIGGTLLAVTAGFNLMSATMGAGGLAGSILGVSGAIAGVGGLIPGLLALAVAVGAVIAVLNFFGPEKKDDGKDHSGEHWQPGTARGGVGGSWQKNDRRTGARRGFAGTLEHWNEATGHYEPVNSIRTATGKPTAVTTVINLDGRKVAENTTMHQSQGASRPQTGRGSFDAGMMPPSPGMNLR